MCHRHLVPRQNTLKTPKEKDEVNKLDDITCCTTALRPLVLSWLIPFSEIGKKIGNLVINNFKRVRVKSRKLRGVTQFPATRCSCPPQPLSSGVSEKYEGAEIFFCCFLPEFIRRSVASLRGSPAHLGTSATDQYLRKSTKIDGTGPV
jgi:hypothetical protein